MSIETVIERPVEQATDQPNTEPTTPTENPRPATPRNTLYRHPTDKVLGGVCGGLAEYLGWDPTLVRVVWVVATLSTGGGGFLAYLALWPLLPVGTVAGGQVRAASIELNEQSVGVAAKVLIALGGLWLLANLGILPSLWDSFWTVMSIVFWPALLIGVGYLLLRGTGTTSNWRSNVQGWQARVRTNIKAPSGDGLKASMKRFGQSLPLKRSRRDRLFMGVCGGIGQKLGIDANLVRLIWVAFSIPTVGVGVLIYVVAGLLLPEEQPADLVPFPAEPQDVQVIDGTASYKL